MSVLQTVDLVEYPESDGKPMAETDAHFACIVRIQDILKHRYDGEDVYVGSNLLIYWIPGDNRASVAPDNFVVLNCPPHRRRTFQTWKERRSPDVVFEVTSRGTRSEDENSKPVTYAQLGVKEYFLFDPMAEYLKPQLKGFRLVAGAYQPIKADRSGALACRKLNLTLSVEDGDLVFRDRQSGNVLPTAAEAAEAERDAEKAAREAAEASVRELEAELKRQRSQSKRKSGKRKP